MTFLDLVAGDSVFIDANTFVYHFAPDPQWSGPCGQLLQRVQTQDITGHTSAAILGEVAHRLMTIEARTRHRWTSGKVLHRLKQSPTSCKRSRTVRRPSQASLGLGSMSFLLTLLRWLLLQP